MNPAMNPHNKENLKHTCVDLHTNVYACLVLCLHFSGALGEKGKGISPSLDDIVFIRLFCSMLPRIMDTDSGVREAATELLCNTVEIFRGKATQNRMFGTKSKK